MKILYISTPSLFDVDLSLIRHLSKKVELIYLLDLPKHNLKTTALNIKKQKKTTGIFKTEIYPEFSSFLNYLKCESYVINRPVSKTFSYETLQLYSNIKKFIKIHNPDIIHYNGLQNFGIFPIFCNKVKKIITVHDPIPHVGDRTLRNKIKRKINFFFVKKIILLNNTQNIFFSNSYNIAFNNMYTSSLGVIEYYNENFNDKFNQSNNSILFFGRITPYKGIDILLKAFEKVNEKLPFTKLVIAGKGDFNFEQYNTNNVSIINRYIPTEELFQLINKSSFVVCPYIEATQSGVIMTAFSLRKPVLVTNVGGLPEMVDHDITGLVCEPNDSKKLSDAIISMLLNPKTLITYSDNIKKIYFGNGEKGWNIITNNIKNIYNSL